MKVPKQQVGIGTILGGRYRILEPLGQGGMAHVYLAEEIESRRKVAIKLMRDELSDDPEFIRRFATEARAAASLDHPNLVRVLDYGQDKSIPYIVQEYVQGQTLKEIIQEKGPLDWAVAIPIMIQTALAIEHAHKHDIIHRDLKPQNVLITPALIAKVTDFGIARASNTNTITLTGGLAFGSVHYFSPEQARGGAVSECSDLYSLGIMLYEMLTGELPFDGDSSVTVAIKQLQEMPLRPSSLQSNLPRSLDDIIFKAIQKSPERRYQSASEFVRELDAFMVEPAGVYGVIRNQGKRWDNGTSALGIDSGESNFSKIKELDKAIKSRRHSRVRDSLLIVIVLAFVFTALYFLIAYVSSRIAQSVPRSSTNTIEVANYIGQNLEQVLAELEQIYGKDKVVIERTPRENTEQGQIYAQEPEFGVLLGTEQRQIKLWVSMPKEALYMPNLVGLTESEARQRLAKLSLSPLIRTEFNESQAKGIVLRQEPPEHTELTTRQTVTLVVSQGSEKVLIPAIEGLSWTEASKLCREKNIPLVGLSVHLDEQQNKKELPESERYIIKQLTDSETEVRSGTALRVEYGSKQDWANRESLQKASFLMPNMVSMDFALAKQLLQMNWPSNTDATVKIIYQNGLTGQEGGLVVLSQSIAAGTQFNPNAEQLTIVVGLASGSQYYGGG